MSSVVFISILIGLTVIGIFIWTFGKRSANSDHETFKYATYLLLITLLQLGLVIYSVIIE
ncbi:hypothetical protein [Piscibacillus halophilus]|uniref:Uncharacterized protein n=1 Tax=Piscibacillus halophilus TaxID=571933 RepID=A0A1H9JT76_9BACI|nr:hypothetical protein [Piscibacillus halophilus]SEQ90029.1 hypothetical protein SAMN05216362_1333 [Piscibacillus halophilus]